MTSLTEQYAESISAARSIEGGVWALALALTKDVQRNGGTALEATNALNEAGVRSSSGDEYKPAWVGKLIRVGRFSLEAESVRDYPLRRVIVAGEKYVWDSEAMLLALQADKTMHQMAGSSLLGKPDRQTMIKEADRLTAADRAALATALISEPEVQEAVLRSAPMAREQFIILGGQIVKESSQRSEEAIKTTFPSHAASDAADEASTAARHLANALAEVIRWNVTTGDDRLNRLESAMRRVEQYTGEINDALGRVTAA